LRAIRDAGWTATAVGGLTMGADPVAYAIARASAEEGQVIEAFSVRKAAKGHGTGKRIEGNFRSDDSVVIVEDVITSGGSAQQAIAAVEGEGGKVLGVLAVVDREEGGRQRLGESGYQVVVLTTVTELGLRK
jgi:orotate phosphoribosyltransferase